MDWPILVILLLSVSRRALSACPPVADALNTVSQEIVPGEVVVVNCASDQLLYTEQLRGYTLQCVGENWVMANLDVAPSVYCAVEETHNCGLAVPPDNSVDIELSNTRFMKAYRCADGFSWLSTLTVQIKHCVAGMWTPIFDVCSPDVSCPVPRDCTYLAEKGVEVNGKYNFIPSGIETYPPIQTTCKFPGAWTLVMEDASNITKIEPDCKNGFDFGGDFFIGINSLHDFNIGDRPMVYQFLIHVENETNHVTYDSVILTTGTNAISALGNIHGTAADGLTPAIGLEFMMMDSNCWWFPSSTPDHVQLLATGEVVWPYELEPTIKMELYVRPSTYDLANSCPAILHTPPEWEGITEVNFTESRDAESEISYRCLLPYMADGESMYQGAVKCQGDYTWSAIPALPCQLLPPPPEFVYADEGTHYLHFSPSPAGSFLEAEQRCNELGSTLATFSLISNLQKSLPGELYYTAYNMRTTAAVAPALPANSLCDGAVCTASAPDAPCILFNNLGNHEAASCFGDHHFICMLPGYCPEPYTLYKGSCYLVKPPLISPILEAYKTCASDGASLVRAYNDTIAYSVAMLAIPSAFHYTGLHDLEVGDLYPIDPAYKASFLTSDDVHWIQISVNDRGMLAYQTTALDGSEGFPICQYPGPIRCLTDPKNITGNWTYDWNGLYDIETAIEYTCDKGYFVGGNTSLSTQTIQCLGQLGEWYPAVKDCIRVKVCPEVFPPGDDFMTIVPGATTRHLKDYIMYTCNDNMTTTTDSLSQKISCEKFSNGSFGYYPESVLSCIVCPIEPIVINATTDWLATTQYTVESPPLKAECIDNHIFSPGITEKYFNCTRTNWEVLPPCYEGCSEQPKTPGSDMTATTATTFAVGETIEYTCTTAGFFIQTADGAKSSVLVSCSTKYKWESVQFLKDCAPVCMEDPTIPAAPVISSWDGITRAINSEVTFTCPVDHLFADRSESFIIRCANDHIWTTIDPGILQCLGVLAPPPLPPGTTYSVVGGTTPYLVNQVVTFVCPAGEASKNGVTSVSVTATSALRWTPLDPYFECFKICLDNPVFPPNGSAAISSWDGLDKTVGVMIEYTCPTGYVFPDKNLTVENECTTEITWSFTDQRKLVCHEVVDIDPPTSDPIVATITGDDTPYILNQVVTITCPENQYSLFGINTTTIKATADGWTPIDLNFSCNELVGEDPPPPSYGLVMETRGPPYVVGSQVNYTCQEGWTPVIDIDVFTLEGDVGLWQPKYVPLIFFCIGKTFLLLLFA